MRLVGRGLPYTKDIIIHKSRIISLEVMDKLGLSSAVNIQRQICDKIISESDR